MNFFENVGSSIFLLFVMKAITVFALIFALASAEVYFSENFDEGMER